MQETVRLSTARGQFVGYFLNERVATQFEALVRDLSCESQILPERLIKRKARRLVFRANYTFDLLGHALIVKAFPLIGLKKRWQYQRYAFREFQHLQEAAQRGLPVPQVYGYMEQKQWGLVCCNAVLMETISGKSLADCLSEPTDYMRKIDLLQSIYPLFASLYRTGCNHIDFKPGSILLSELRLVIIDFHYVRFFDRPSSTILAAQAGYFAWNVAIRHRWVLVEDMDAWFQQLLIYMALQPTERLWQVFRQTRLRRAPIEQRLTGNY